MGLRYGEEGQKERYFADDDKKDLDQLVREQRYGDPGDMDAAFAANVASKARYRCFIKHEPSMCRCACAYVNHWQLSKIWPICACQSRNQHWWPWTRFPHLCMTDCVEICPAWQNLDCLEIVLMAGLKEAALGGKVKHSQCLSVL